MAMDVPLKNAQQPSEPQVPGTELRTLMPLAMRSGFTRKSTSVGPWLLNSAWM